MDITSNYSFEDGTEINVCLAPNDIDGECKFIVSKITKKPNVEEEKYSRSHDTFESALLDFYHNCYFARMYLTDKEVEGKTETDICPVKKHTMQEIADFFGCYVAKDDIGDSRCYVYKRKPMLDDDLIESGKKDDIYYDPFRWCTDGEEDEFFAIPSTFVELDNVDWKVLYKGE